MVSILLIPGVNRILRETMTLYQKYLNRYRLAAWVVLACWGVVSSASAQELAPAPLEPPPVKVNRIYLGPHPDKTRLLIDLDQESEYRIIPDYTNKRLGIFLRNARLHPRVRALAYKDIHLARIDVREVESIVKITVYFKKSNTAFVHHFNRKASQIVLDLGGATVLPLAKSLKKKEPQKQPKKPRVKGLSKNKIEKATRDDKENKLKWGWKEYTRALDLYQQRKYPEATPALKKYIETYTLSPYRANAAFLLAEAEFKIALQKPEPNFEKAISAYRFAIQYLMSVCQEKLGVDSSSSASTSKLRSCMNKESPFYDHALYKLASIYDELGFTLEAKTLYDDGIKGNERSRYNDIRKIGLARMMLKEDRLEEAYEAFQVILKDDKTAPKARSSMYAIAKKYYERNDLPTALRIYEDAVNRWDEELGKDPAINFTIGEIYFSQGQYSKARRFYFNLVNLAPELPNAHKALNRIGDTYLFEGNGLAAYNVFNRSMKVDPEDYFGKYARIRMADIGIRYPGLNIPDLIFDNPAYFKPYQTFDEMFKNSTGRNIRAEVVLSRGKAYFQEQRFLQAIQEHKRLLNRDKNSRYYRSAKNYIRLALVHLIDQYSTQRGALPILYAYNEYLSLDLGKIENIKSLLQIGEAYKAIGMHSEALKFFERVKLVDTQATYTSRLFLDLGEIHLAQSNFSEAELVSKTFLNNYKMSPEVPRALMLLAAAYKGQKKFAKAISTYRGITHRTDVNPAEAHSLLGDIWMASNDLAKAAESYRNVVDSYDRSLLNPQDYIQSSYYKLGIVYHMQKRYSESLNTLKSARKLFPNHSLQEWAGFLVADNLQQLSQDDKALLVLQDLTQQKDQKMDDDALVLKAAKIRLKVLDWEKRLKERL